MVDASQVGMGDYYYYKMVSQWHMHQELLTPSEMRYANIEREMLAVVSGPLKYHHDSYCRRYGNAGQTINL